MIKFALAVPCHNFIENAHDIFEQHNRLGSANDFETYSMEEVIVTEQNVKTVSIEADVIITRGLLAEILKSIQGDIPVVEIQVPATDTLRVVLNCAEKFHAKKVGIIASHNMVMGATEISSFLDIPFQTYVLTTSWNGPQLVDQALKDGCDAIVGGLNTCNYASSINVPNLFITTGRDSFWQSITAAKRAAAISRAEQEKTSRLQVILNTSKEGLLSIDTLKRIRMTNQAAERILKLNSSIIGKRVMDAPFPIEFKKLLINDQACSNELFKYEDTYFNVNKYPIWVHQNNMGIVVSFQEVNDIVNLESHIRRKILNKGHLAKNHFENIVEQSQVMEQTIEIAKKYSCTDSNILLTGQSGTGKELFAQSIHNHSARSGGPFVAVNCAAIPDSLLESELFGYEAGAFTGAQKNGKPGYFELAHNGTLFLDEIGELPLQFQAKLLRVIQEREVMRIGGDRIIDINIRIIAATNRDLMDLSAKGDFREDLYYRLDVLHIDIPPLNRRPEDIPLLARHFLSGYPSRITITDEACQALSRYEWPGNIRQLFNICERLAVLCTGHTIHKADVADVLPVPVREGGGATSVKSSHTSFKDAHMSSTDAHMSSKDTLPSKDTWLISKDTLPSKDTWLTLKDTLPSSKDLPSASKDLIPASADDKTPEERLIIMQVLQETHYNRGEAAKRLHISRSTLWRKMKQYGL